MLLARASLIAVCIGAVLAIPGPLAAAERRFSEHENLNEAILAARATLDLFWQVVSHQPCGCSGVILAVELPWDGRVIDVDVTEVRRLADGRIEGRVEYRDVTDAPQLADTVVTFSDDDIIDWGFGRDGAWYGLYLFQAIRAGAVIVPAAKLEADMRQKFQAVRLPE